MDGSVAAIAARSVSKRYPTGALALDDVSFSVPRGPMVALVGPSGSGKTTFFRLCNGAVRPTGGELEVLGVAMSRARGRELGSVRSRVAMVYQGHNLVGSVSVLHNVLLGRMGKQALPAVIKTMTLPSHEEQLRVYRLLEQLGIPEKLLTRADELSGGQRQRVAIARALIQEPEVLLADEPVASVDTETAGVVLGILARICRERGVTVIVSLHQRGYVDEYCDRLIELRQGRVVEDISLRRDGLSWQREPTPAIGAAAK